MNYLCFFLEIATDCQILKHFNHCDTWINESWGVSQVHENRNTDLFWVFIHPRVLDLSTTNFTRKYIILRFPDKTRGLYGSPVSKLFAGIARTIEKLLLIAIFPSLWVRISFCAHESTNRIGDTFKQTWTKHD